MIIADCFWGTVVGLFRLGDGSTGSLPILIYRWTPRRPMTAVSQEQEDGIYGVGFRSFARISLQRSMHSLQM